MISQLKTEGERLVLSGRFPAPFVEELKEKAAKKGVSINRYIYETIQERWNEE